MSKNIFINGLDTIFGGFRIYSKKDYVEKSWYDYYHEIVLEEDEYQKIKVQIREYRKLLARLKRLQEKIYHSDN